MEEVEIRISLYVGEEVGVVERFSRLVEELKKRLGEEDTTNWYIEPARAGADDFEDFILVVHPEEGEA